MCFWCYHQYYISCLSTCHPIAFLWKKELADFLTKQAWMALKPTSWRIRTLDAFSTHGFWASALFGVSVRAKSEWVTTVVESKMFCACRCKAQPKSPEKEFTKIQMFGMEKWKNPTGLKEHLIPFQSNKAESNIEKSTVTLAWGERAPKSNRKWNVKTLVHPRVTCDSQWQRNWPSSHSQRMSKQSSTLEIGCWALGWRSNASRSFGRQDRSPKTKDLELVEVQAAYPIHQSLPRLRQICCHTNDIKWHNPL